MNFQFDDVIGKFQEVIFFGFLISRDVFINFIFKDVEFKFYGKFVYLFIVYKGIFIYLCR